MAREEIGLQPRSKSYITSCSKGFWHDIFRGFTFFSIFRISGHADKLSAAAASAIHQNDLSSAGFHMSRLQSHEPDIR